jgi:predicted naringenin-chalcone synthase
METPNAFLHSFQPVFPRYHLPQNQLVDWTFSCHKRAIELVGAHDLEKLQSYRRYCLDEDQIRERYYECDDVNEKWNEHAIYNVEANTLHGKNIEERHAFFEHRAREIFAEIYHTTEVPDHLIHVTCTGYLSPSPAQQFFSGREIRPEISHAYHMGCYASLPAVRIGEGIVRGRNLNVDIVHTEMCSIHMDPLSYSAEQMVMQSLFADGHIKYRLSQEKSGTSLRLLATHEEIVPESANDMTWVPGPYGMKMTLSKEVPFKIGMKIGPFLGRLSEKAGLNVDQLRKEAIFAVHPGGPKIVSGVRDLLGLSEEQVTHSRKVLRERGNMSSATLPHVWKEIIDANPGAGTKVVAFAFGPGLTIIGAVFEVA